jgi:hypothetical protein
VQRQLLIPETTLESKEAHHAPLFHSLQVKSLLREFQKLSRESGTGSFVFVLKKDESFVPVLIAKALEPIREVRFGIVDAPQTQIAPVRRLINM